MDKVNIKDAVRTELMIGITTEDLIGIVLPTSCDEILFTVDDARLIGSKLLKFADELECMLAKKH